jgi:hypothetical protein
MAKSSEGWPLVGSSHEGRARRQRNAVHRSDRLGRGVGTPAAPAVTARVLGHPEAAVSQVALPTAVAGGRMGRVATVACDGGDGSCQHDADLEGDVAVGGGGGSWERVAAHDGGFDGNRRREGRLGGKFCEHDHGTVRSENAKNCLRKIRTRPSTSIETLLSIFRFSENWNTRRVIPPSMFRDRNRDDIYGNMARIRVSFTDRLTNDYQ